MLSGLLKTKNQKTNMLAIAVFPTCGTTRRLQLVRFFLTQLPPTGLSEPQPPFGLCYLSRNHQQVPGGSYTNTVLHKDDLPLWGEGACPFILCCPSPELDGLHRTDICLLKEFMSEWRPTSTGRLSSVLKAFRIQTTALCRTCIVWGSRLLQLFLVSAVSMDVLNLFLHSVP